MAEFRKWLLAFAVVALVSSLAVPASAQAIQQTVTCTASSGGNPPLVRAEGLAELVGDVVLVCQGGTPTQAGQPVPLVNVNIFLTTNVTSRIVSGNDLTEALLIVDEPHSPTNPLTPLLPCYGGIAPCQTIAPGGGVGTYNGTPGFPNIFQGRTTFNPNQISFNGVPFDPPGTTGNRTLRITNVRANANLLGVSSTLIPSQITEFVSISGQAGGIAVNNPQATVAFIQPGLRTNASSAVSFQQCISRNPTAAGGGSTFEEAANLNVGYQEGFASSWKVRNVVQSGIPGSNSSYPVGVPLTAIGGDFNQDIVGVTYNTESGFFAGTGNEISAFGVPPTANVPFSGSGLQVAGQATQGTRLFVNLNTTPGTSSVPAGTSIFMPTQAPLYDPADGTITGFAVLVSTDASGAGGSVTSIPAGTVTVGTAAAGSGLSGTAKTAFANFQSGASNPNVAPVATLGFSAVTGTAVYEVVQTDPNRLEAIALPANVAFVSNVANNLPAPTPAMATGALGFAPISNVGTASSTAPVPRFVPSGTPSNLFSINLCSCNILFPFITNQQGFDTGVAISNTSQDPFGTGPQSGNVKLYYYSSRVGTAPPPQSTTSPVDAGDQLLFTVSGGGNHGIAATPGFQGYIIAVSNFQYCHAFAYISAQGALPTAPGASEGYLGIVLDVPVFNRTGQAGEVQAH